MFRLVKVLNGNNQYEAYRLGFVSNMVIEPGCALMCSGGNVAVPSATAMPNYIALSRNSYGKKKIEAMLVTEDMVFLVEFTGSVDPTIGMSVGLTTKTYKMDAVTYNSNGKGTIIGIGDNRMVYVTFHK